MTPDTPLTSPTASGEAQPPAGQDGCRALAPTAPTPPLAMEQHTAAVAGSAAVLEFEQQGCAAVKREVHEEGQHAGGTADCAVAAPAQAQPPRAEVQQAQQEQHAVPP